MNEYTKLQTIIANLPYGGMILLGAAVIACGFGFAAWALAAAAVYILYGAVGALWIMLHVCPYCTYYDTRGCPCGYGVISAKLVQRGSVGCFAEKFKRHIPVIVPLWLIPLAGGVIAVIGSFSWGLFALLALFLLNSYVVLPLVSRKHSCLECPQKDECPWMTDTSPFHIVNGKRV